MLTSRAIVVQPWHARRARHRGAAALVVLFALLGVARQGAAQGNPTSQCGITIDIHVIDAATHTPIAEALVSVGDQLLGLTDGAGTLTQGGQCAGEAVFTVDKVGYHETRQTVRLTASRTLELELGAEPSEVITIKGEAAPLPETRATTTLTGEALARTRGKSLAEALGSVAGVTQLQSGTGAAKPMIRGQFGRRIAMMVDGVPHRSQDWGIDHAPELDPFTASSIAVVRGAAGVAYGGNATGGAVDVRSAPLLDNPGLAGEFHLIGMWDRGGGAALRLRGRPRAHPQVAWNLEASGKQLAAAQSPTYALHNTGVRDGTLGLVAAYAGRRVQQTVTLRRYQARLGVCNCLRMESLDDFKAQLALGRPIDADLYRSSFEIDRPYQDVRHDTLASRTRIDLGDTARLDVTYALQLDNRGEYDVVRTATGPQFDFALQTHDLNATLDHAPLHINEHLHLDGEAGVAAMLQTHRYAGLPFVPSHHGYTIAPYASERLQGHDFDLDLGLRYEITQRTATIAKQDFRRMVRNGQLTDATCEPNGDEDRACTSHFSALAASLGGIYAATPSLDVKSNLSITARAPNPDEQYLNGTSPTFPVYGLGDPSLGVETTYAASAGVASHAAGGEAEPGRVTGEASIYANYVDDYVYFAPALDAGGAPIYDVLIRGTFPRFTTRAVRAVFWGGEAAVTVAAHEHLELHGQVAAIRARNLTDDDYLMFVPADTARVTATFHHPLLWTIPNLRATVGATATRRQDRVDERADLAPPPDGYVLLDAGIEATFSAGQASSGEPGDVPLRVSIDATNLLDTRYRDYTSLMRYFADQPGRRVMVRISASWGAR